MLFVVEPGAGMDSTAMGSTAGDSSAVDSTATGSTTLRAPHLFRLRGVDRRKAISNMVRT